MDIGDTLKRYFKEHQAGDAHTYQHEPTYNSLTALADFAQAEYVKRAPPTKTNRKRGRAEEINFRTAAVWGKKVRLALQAEKEQQQQQPPSNIIISNAV